MKDYKSKIISKGLFATIIFVVITIIYIMFNLTSSLGFLSIDGRTVLYDLGIYNNERAVYGVSFVERDQYGKMFRWVEDRSEIAVRVRGELMIIQIFNSKPDISSDPVGISVYVNDEEVFKHTQKINDVESFGIDVGKMGFRENDFINLKFISDKSWRPKDYEISDDERNISFALREIIFVDE